MSHAWVRTAPAARGDTAGGVVARLSAAWGEFVARRAARRLERATAGELARLARTGAHLLDDVGVPVDQRGTLPPRS